MNLQNTLQKGTKENNSGKLIYKYSESKEEQKPGMGSSENQLNNAEITGKGKYQDLEKENYSEVI